MAFLHIPKLTSTQGSMPSKGVAIAEVPTMPRASALPVSSDARCAL